MIDALYITVDAIKRDKILQPGQRGTRKLVVKDIYPGKEKEADNCVWDPALENCPVQKITNYQDTNTCTEIAVFNELTQQDRHCHKIGTEIYMVMEGKMIIEVKDIQYPLNAGDMIIVNPGAVHEVKPLGTSFLCRLVTVNCKGEADKNKV